MTKLPTIAGLWVGSDLTWLEQLCLQSFLDHGHPVILYTLGPVGGIPGGVIQRPAEDVYGPPPFDISDNDRQRVAVYSDLFRLHLMRDTAHIWADLDALCTRAIDFDTTYLFAEPNGPTTPIGILRLPSASPALAGMLDYVLSPNPTQPWRGAKRHRANAERIARGERWGIESLPWGCAGPRAMTHFLTQTGEVAHALPSHVFYPLGVDQLWMLHDPNVIDPEVERTGSHSVHIYGHQKKLLANRAGGLPVPGSYLDRKCAAHGIVPTDAPIVPLVWM
ncbi:hypothetical protein FHS89_002743 [Rubricella aquisinus]|uniref:Uncharacterized protein n=1 Tax=Rubricella aquisinus TaxID=2028108 RepID=A0A840WRN7_9RHOB|nr:hypothetical protein [Rubricella aquisinus]MBB5516703.1 hypothetical protein [Rubricella aquisinus]